MTEINKARELRTALGWTPTECGTRLCGFSKASAYDRWTQWESGTRKPSAGVDRYFDLLLFLVLCREHKTVGAGLALDKFLALVSGDKNDE